MTSSPAHNPTPLARETFASQVASLRNALGLTQEQLAERVGVGMSTVRRWERKGDLPQKDAARKLISVLNITEPSVLRYLRNELSPGLTDIAADAGIIPIGDHVAGVGNDTSPAGLRDEALRGMIAGLQNGYVTGSQYMDLAERVARMTGLPWT